MSEVERLESNGGSFDYNVQAMASEILDEVPPQFLQREDDRIDVVPVDDSLQIPVIDMSKLLDDQKHEFDRLHSACKEWGFFQLINHGIPKEVLENLKVDMEEMFKMPLEKKKEYAQVPPDIEGYGRLTFAVNEGESLDWTDSFFLTGLPVSQRRMRFWPRHPTSFRENLDKYTREVKKVQTRLLQYMSACLGLDPEALSGIFEGGRQLLRMCYYPPCVQADKVMGLSPHSDISGLTMLLQANDVQGLQIKKNGKWVAVNNVPDAFTVNIGNTIEVMSNGEYPSIEHRVVVNPKRHRISIGAFHEPPVDTTVGPLPDLIKNNKAKYITTTFAEHLRIYHETSRIDGKGPMARMKLEE